MEDLEEETQRTMGFLPPGPMLSRHLQMETPDPCFRVLFDDPHKFQTLRSRVSRVCVKAGTIGV